MPLVQNLCLSALHAGSQADLTTPRTRLSRTQKLPFEEERVISRGEKKLQKLISGRGNTNNLKLCSGLSSISQRLN